MKPISLTGMARLLFAGTVVVLVVSLGAAVLALPPHAPGLASEVDAALGQSGVQSRVTAVLLNFRGYDTLLEITVLLLAVLGARNLGMHSVRQDTQEPFFSFSPVLTGMIRLLAPLMVLFAGYLLWVGGHGAGGAFQAGAMLAALGTLLLLSGVDWTRLVSGGMERGLLVVGLAVFLVASVTPLTGGYRWLQFPAGQAKWYILMIETGAMVSIAAILLALYRGGSLAARHSHPTPSQEDAP